jgi:ribosome biogenesis GTPase
MRVVPDLETLGWDDAWAVEFEPYRVAGLVPGRVSAPHRGASYDVLTARGENRAQLPGRMRHEAESPAALPVVGDWVALEERRQGTPRIRGVLPRRTKLSRRSSPDPATEVGREQVVAANVDIVFLAVSLGDEPNPVLLERYLALAWTSGAAPVFLLTKADLHAEPERAAADVSRVGGEVLVVVISVRTGLGLDSLRSLLQPGVTAALVGPSGVGKSTLVNTLVGEQRLATGSLRDDGTGRHTTTRRQLVLLPGGGMVVDNPGIRELHLWLAADALEDSFEDIAELALRCRFTDCRHETEPDCAVQAALADGTLAPERWRAYRELERERAELEAKLSRRRRPRAGRSGPGPGTS